MIDRILLDTLVTGLPMVPVFLGIYTVFRIRADFDLTVEGSFALGGAATAVAAVHGASPLVALVLGALAGGAAGLVTAGLHRWLRVPVLLAGLVMSIGLFSVTLHVMGEPTLSLLLSDTLARHAAAFASPDLVITAILGVIVLVVLAAYALLLRTEIGLALRATGVNAGMARSQGVNDRASLALALFVANASAGLGAGLLVQTQGYADVNMGVGVFVSGVGAVLLGELLVRPTGSKVLRIVLCVLIGTLVYRLILVAALRIGLPAGDLRGITALTLIVAVAAERYLGVVVRRTKVTGLVTVARRA
jgi:putative ABC transport system permease protein